MPYIGHNPTQAGSFVLLDDIASGFDGDDVTFTLQVGSVDITPTADNLIIALDGVIQHSPEAYTVSGSTLTFTAAPASGVDFYGMLMGQSASIGQGSIGADELAVTGDGSANQMLVSDGDGTMTWKGSGLSATSATGDLIYRNSSGELARLAVGSSGQVLTVASGVPAWETDVESYLPLSGGTMSGALNMGSQAITNAGTITGTFSGNLTGNVTGNTSGSAASVTGAAQTNITSVGTLTSLAITSSSATGLTVDVGLPSSANREIARFQAQSSRPIAFGWIDSGSKISLYTPSDHSLVLGTGAIGTNNLEITDAGAVNLSHTLYAEGNIQTSDNLIVSTSGQTDYAIDNNGGAFRVYRVGTGAGMAIDASLNTILYGTLEVQGNYLTINNSAQNGIKIKGNDTACLYIYDAADDSLSGGLTFSHDTAEFLVYTNGVSTNSEALKIASDNTATFRGEIKSVGNLTISPNTSDGSDNARLNLAGGGSNDISRGAWLELFGNEYGDDRAGQINVGAENGIIFNNNVQIKQGASGVTDVNYVGLSVHTSGTSNGIQMAGPNGVTHHIFFSNVQDAAGAYIRCYASGTYANDWLGMTIGNKEVAKWTNATIQIKPNGDATKGIELHSDAAKVVMGGSSHTLSAHFAPSANNTYNLGHDGTHWATMWVEKIGMGITDSPQTSLQVSANSAGGASAITSFDVGMGVEFSSTEDYYAGIALIDSGVRSENRGFIGFKGGHNSGQGYSGFAVGVTSSSSASTAEKMWIKPNGDVYFLGETGAPWDRNSGVGFLIQHTGVVATAMGGGAGSSCYMANKTAAEGHMMDFAYDNSIKGYINLDGETVSLVGFSGQHESETSDKAKSIPKGTVMSSIGTTFKADHVKTKISDSVGDVSVYGVVSSYASYDTGADKDVDYRMILNAVGIAEVLVTGKASIGDLIESNGDGSAKVQDDEIIRSKTIGKVTKAKTTTSKGLALCVLYCG